MEKWLVRYKGSDVIDWFYPKRKVEGGYIGDIIKERSEKEDYFLDLNKWEIVEKK